MSFLGNLLGTNVNTNFQAPNINFSPAGFSGGGLSGNFSGNSFNLSSSQDRQAAVQGVANTFGQQAQDIAGIRSQWAPGASNLLNTQLTALQNNRQQALGDLRSNLAQRRVLGSSFAQNSLANADQTYQQQIAQTTAQTFLTELQAQQQLSQQQFAAARGQFQTGLDEMNLEAGIASQLGSQASSAMASIAQTQAQLQMQAQALSLQAQTTNANNTMKTLSGLGQLGGMALSGGLGGFSGLSSMFSGGGGLAAGQAFNNPNMASSFYGPLN